MPDSETGVDGVRVLPPVYGPFSHIPSPTNTTLSTTNSETGGCTEGSLPPVYEPCWS